MLKVCFWRECHFGVPQHKWTWGILQEVDKRGSSNCKNEC